MPDITYPHTITAATTTNASDVAENLFYAKGVQDNLEVINRLDRVNFAVPLITRQMVRPGALFEGGSTGHTANRDYFKQMYPAGWDATDVPEAALAAVPVAGLCKTRRFDNESREFCADWSFGVIVDAGNQIGTNENAKEYGFFTPTTENRHTSIHLFINGVRINPANYFLNHSDTTLGQYEAGFNRPGDDDIAPIAYHQDSRWIFGSWLIDEGNVGQWFSGDAAEFSPLLRGIHTAELRVASKKRIVRFKSSNISIMGMR